MELPDDAEVRETHISKVFLTADRAYKTKKPKALGFLDYSTRALRLAACEAEVRLNRRLAPDVYLGVVSLPDGEPAVEMVRLRDEDSLQARLDRGAVDAALAARVGRLLGRFHLDAPTSPEIAAHGASDRVWHHVAENFETTRAHVPALCHPALHARLEARSHERFAALRSVLERRRTEGRVRDGHGDLRLEHVYVDGDTLRVIDGVEFSDAYRCADVAMDVAFLWMDLVVRSRRDLARAMFDAWVETTGDPGAREVLPFFSAYRSIVRAKVAGLTLADPTLSDARRAALTLRARRHWSCAWVELVAPTERPILVGVAGRPGTGKTTVARGLADQGYTVVRSDVVRKALAGLPETERLGAGSYDRASRDRVYAECFRRAEDVLATGQSVVVDASFTRDAWREALLDVAERWAVPCCLLVCEAPHDVVVQRIVGRRGDASDADVDVYEATPWEPESARTRGAVTRLSTEGPPADAVRRAVARLEAAAADAPPERAEPRGA